MGIPLWTPRAETHLEEIAWYIAVEAARPSAAEKIAHEIHEKAVLYADNPQLESALSEDARKALGIHD